MSSEVPSVRRPAELPEGVSQATIGVRGGLLRSGFEETAEAMYLTSGYVYSSAPEAETIRAALDAGVGYIGLVASRVRGASILGGLDLSEAERRRVHTPVGLPIGAKTPAEIAVSIVAEVIKAIRVDGLKADA